MPSLFSIFLALTVAGAADTGSQQFQADSAFQTLWSSYLQFSGNVDSALKFLHNTGAVKLQLQILLSSNLPDSVIKIARSVLSKSPDKDVWMYLIQAYILKGEPKKAEKELKKLLKYAPDDPDVKAFAGRVYANINRPQLAVKFLKQAIKDRPESLSLFRALGLTYLMLNQPDSALKYLTRYDSTSSAENDVELIYAIASAYEKKGNISKAIEIYENRIKLLGRLTPLLAMHLARLYEMDGQYKNAIQIANSLLESYMFEPGLYKLLARCYDAVNDLKNAFYNSVTAAYLSPRDAEAHYMVARIAYEMGNLDMALKEARLASKYGNDPDYRVIEAMIYLLKEKPNKAYKIVKKIKNNPKASWVCYYVNLNYRKHLEDALDCIEDAYLITRSLTYGVEYAALLDSMGFHAKADTVLVELISNYPDSASAWLAYAEHNFKTDAVAADSAFRIAASLDSTNPAIFNNWAYLLAENNVRLDEADSLVDIALSMDSTNPYYLDTKAWVLYHKGQYSKAKEIEEQALQQMPDEAEYNEHMGFILIALGKNDEAVPYFEKALKLDPSRTYLQKFIAGSKK